MSYRWPGVGLDPSILFLISKFKFIDFEKIKFKFIDFAKANFKRAFNPIFEKRRKILKNKFTIMTPLQLLQLVRIRKSKRKEFVFSP